MAKTEYTKQLEELIGAPIDTILKSLYLDPDFKSTCKVEEIVGLCISTVFNKLKKTGIELRKDVPDKRLRELYEKYESFTKVGKEVGLDASSVGDRLKKTGVGFSKSQDNLESALQAYRADYLGAGANG